MTPDELKNCREMFEDWLNKTIDCKYEWSDIAGYMPQEIYQLYQAWQAAWQTRSETDGWQDIMTAPRDGTWIKVKMPDGLEDVAQWCDYSNDKFPHYLEDGSILKGEWNSQKGNVYTEPTHWMPLPKPPKTVE